VKIPMKRFTLLIAPLALLLVTSIAWAQSGGGYDLTWWTVDGGGATASGGDYTLIGTAGQPEPGPALSGGDFTLIGGFWFGEGAAPSCDAPLTGVSLSGPNSGDTGQTLTFTASPQPANADTPINYTWSNDGLVGGQGTNQATYRWDSAGAKTVQVTANNCGGQDFSASQPVTISSACAKPLTNVSITGLDSGYTDANYDFTAAPTPNDATTPLTYTWSADGLISGQSTYQATYSWAITGVHAISVTAENCGGSATTHHTITLSAQPSNCDYPITGVTIDGPSSGSKDTDIAFTAVVQTSNGTATPPVAYAWSSDGLVSGQSTAVATYRWNQAGSYVIAVSAGNCGGSKNDTHAIEIDGKKKIYLPLIMRNK
jgi:hypothetical protein